MGRRTLLYKFISLKKSNSTGEFKWVERDIEYDREDCGEYEIAGNYYIYRNSDTVQWKRKIIQRYREEIINTYTRNLKLLQDLELIQQEYT